MYSLNQVNKLVSCGRDPARSLPLWRGFLLIPLILVCFAFAPQTRAIVTGPRRVRYPAASTRRKAVNALIQHHRRCNTRLRLEFALSDTAGDLQYWRWCWNAGPQQWQMIRTRPLALLPCYSTLVAPETQLLERPRWSITQAMPSGHGII